MTDRPIIFSGPMVRALLGGRKTQTRRILKDVPPQPEPDCHPKHQQRHPAPYLDSYCSNPRSQANPRGMSDWWSWWQVDDRCCLPQFRVPYVPGDRLWVRETFCQFADDARDGQGSAIYYRANHGNDTVTAAQVMKRNGVKWTPPIHMPRWASRLTLHVMGVKVERLQAISREDAIAEGWAEIPNSVDQVCPVAWYSDLWDQINGVGAWDRNPWVVAVTFRVVRANIDSAEARAA